MKNKGLGFTLSYKEAKDFTYINRNWSKRHFLFQKNADIATGTGNLWRIFTTEQDGLQAH